MNNILQQKKKVKNIVQSRGLDRIVENLIILYQEVDEK